VLSPQYLTWLAPLVPAVSLDAALLFAAALVLTRLEWEEFVKRHGGTAHWGQVLSWWILVRDLVLVSVFAATTRRIRR